VRHFIVIGFVLLATAALRASPGSDVREAVERLHHESSYAWVVTTGSEGVAPTAVGVPRPVRRSAGRVVASGRQDRESVAIVTMPNPLLKSDVTVVRTAIRAVAQTPLGWLTPDEIEQAYRRQQDEEIRFEGRTVRLFRCLDAARMALERETPEQELARLLTELGAFAGTRDEITGQLTPAGALTAALGLGAPPTTTNHQFDGTVTFRFRGVRLVEYEVNVTSRARIPGDSDEHEVNHRQVTTISGFSSTMVVAPPAAFDRLIR
jgi:hypothetical protein